MDEIWTEKPLSTYILEDIIKENSIRTNDISFIDIYNKIKHEKKKKKSN